MRQRFFLFCIILPLIMTCSACLGTDDDDGIRMLREAAALLEKDEQAAYEGRSVVKIDEQIAYRMPNTVLPAAGTSAHASNAAQDIVIPLRELPDAAQSAEIDRTSRRGKEVALRVRVDPDRAKESVVRYFTAQMAAIREKITVPGEPRAELINRVAAEESELNELLRSMTVEADYTVWINPSDRRISAVDAVTKLRYTRDGKKMVETVSGTYTPSKLQ